MLDPKVVKIDPHDVESLDKLLIEQLAEDQDYLDWLEYLDVLISDKMDHDVMFLMKYQE